MPLNPKREKRKGKAKIEEQRNKYLTVGVDYRATPKYFPLIFGGDHTAECIFAFLCDFGRLVKAIRNNGGWFYCSMERIRFSTFASRFQQERTFKVLKTLDLIEVERMGNMARRHFRIKNDTLEKFYHAFLRRPSFSEEDDS